MINFGRLPHIFLPKPPRAWIVVAVALTAAAFADAPSFAVRDGAGKSHIYSAGPRAGEGTRYADAIVDATVLPSGPDQWELTLTARVDLTEVWFPWPKDAIEPRAASGAALYVAEVGGARIRAAALKEYDWAGAMYPSGCFAPLLIQSNERSAWLMAATNWPPRQVRPLHSLDRLSLRYEERVEAGSRNSYRALLKRIEGDESAGRPPWLLAVDAYRGWLTERMRAEHLLPIAYPQWMRDADGWIYVNLSDIQRFSISELQTKWDRWRGVLPWMQVWGQMSNYCGPRHLASPAVGVGEETGCCLNNARIHSRYLPELPEFARSVAREGRIGFYTRPGPERPRLDAKAPDGGSGADLKSLLDWIARNRDEYGANAGYIDILGNLYCGDILTVARLIRDRFPPETVIEYGVDCYPAAMLLSGSLSNGGTGTPETLAKGAAERLPFPRLARALFCDRIVFLGGANGDSTWWGRRAAYRAERNAFLLGAKLDAWETEEDRKGGGLNQAIVEIVAARKRTGWWRREPVYRDVLDVTDVTAGVDIRRFTGKDGEELFAVDNWMQRPSPSFRFRGREMRLGNEALMIAVLPASEAARP